MQQQKTTVENPVFLENTKQSIPYLTHERLAVGASVLPTNIPNQPFNTFAFGTQFVQTYQFSRNKRKGSTQITSSSI
jgi:hypothetical protein